MNFKSSSIMAIAGIAVMVSLIVVNPAFAAGAKSQTYTTPAMNGYAYVTPDYTSISASASLSGKILTKDNGQQTLSPLAGNLVIGDANYNLQLKPNGDLTTQSASDSCSSYTSTIQIGEAKLTGNDGRAVKGIGLIQTYSSDYNCYGYEYHYQQTYLTIITQDTQGKLLQVSVGANGLPTIQ
jgi:hypothetical protein